MNFAINHRLKYLGGALFVNNLQVNRASIKINRLDLQLFDLQSKAKRICWIICFMKIVKNIKNEEPALGIPGLQSNLNI